MRCPICGKAYIAVVDHFTVKLYVHEIVVDKTLGMKVYGECCEERLTVDGDQDYGVAKLLGRTGA